MATDKKTIKTINTELSIIDDDNQNIHSAASMEIHLDAPNRRSTLIQSCNNVDEDLNNGNLANIIYERLLMYI